MTPDERARIVEHARTEGRKAWGSTLPAAAVDALRAAAAEARRKALDEADRAA